MTISGRERLWTAPSSRLDPDPRGNCVYVIELYSDIEKKNNKKNPEEKPNLKNPSDYHITVMWYQFQRFIIYVYLAINTATPTLWNDI